MFFHKIRINVTIDIPLEIQVQLVFQDISHLQDDIISLIGRERNGCSNRWNIRELPFPCLIKDITQDFPTIIVFRFWIKNRHGLPIPISSSDDIENCIQNRFFTINTAFPVSQVLKMMELTFQSLTTHDIFSTRKSWRKEYIYIEREKTLDVKHHWDVASHSCSKTMIQLRAEDMYKSRILSFFDFV